MNFVNTTKDRIDFVRSTIERHRDAAVTCTVAAVEMEKKAEAALHNGQLGNYDAFRKNAQEWRQAAKESQIAMETAEVILKTLFEPFMGPVGETLYDPLATHGG